MHLRMDMRKLVGRNFAKMNTDSEALSGTAGLAEWIGVSVQTFVTVTDLLHREFTSD